MIMHYCTYLTILSGMATKSHHLVSYISIRYACPVEDIWEVLNRFAKQSLLHELKIKLPYKRENNFLLKLFLYESRYRYNVQTKTSML